MKCDKDVEVVLNASILNPSDINESDVILNWSVNSQNYDSLVIRVSDSKEMSNVIHKTTLVDKTIISQKVDELSGLTDFYYHIDLWRDGTLEFTSEMQEFTLDILRRLLVLLPAMG